MNHCAQWVSLYLSGMPVNTSTVKLMMTRKCIQRWNTLKRRYSMRVVPLRARPGWWAREYRPSFQPR